MGSAEDRELSARITRACIEKGINPALADCPGIDDSWPYRSDRLPEDCPIPEMWIYHAFYFPRCQGYAISVMLEQHVGSMSYWIPVEFIGPNVSKNWRDDEPKGWKISVMEQHHGWKKSYADLWELSNHGWWPTLEQAWEAIPRSYKYYDPAWRQRSLCDTCHCTGVVLHNSLVCLPCPDCRTTPDLVYGWLDLMWVPAGTPDRAPHARPGAIWRWRFGGDTRL